MNTEIIKLAGLKDHAAAADVARALRTVHGVAGVRMSLSEHRATVQFDGNRTSVQALRATLTQAGYALAAMASGNEAEGQASGCCGHCGG